MSSVITNVFSILKSFTGFTRNFDTVADAVSDKFLRAGQKITIKERKMSVFDVVLSSSVIPNSFDIIKCTGVNTLSIVLYVKRSRVFTSQMGAYSNPNSALQLALDKYKIVDLDEDYSVNIDNLFTPVSGSSYNYALKLKTGNRLITSTGKKLSSPTIKGAIVHIPVGVNDCKISKVTFEGSGSSSNDVNNLAFAIATAIDTSVVTKDFKDITIKSCKFSGFNVDIDIRAADKVKIFHNEHKGTFYSRATGAVAGYQCHLASCSRVERAHNIHTAGGFDRHAFYLATAQAGVNSKINSHDNFYDWDLTDFTQNPFMSAINLRPGKNIHIHHETIIKPHGGGITSITDSSNDFNGLIIDHNIIKDITTAATASVPVVVGSGISLRPSGGGNYYDTIIDNNVITTLNSADGSRINAMSLSGIDTRAINNKIKLNGTVQNAVNIALGTLGLSIDGNTFVGDGTQTSPMFFDLQVAANDFRWGKNIVKGFAGHLVDTFNGTPTYDTSIICRDVTVKVVSDGVGGITFETDLAVVTSVQAIGGGFSITFPDWFKPVEKAKQFSTGSSLVRNIYDANSSATTNNIIVYDSLGAQIGAATNAYTVYVTYKDLRQ